VDQASAALVTAAATDRHDVRRWTVGELRRSIAGLPDDLTLRVEVVYGPSTHTREPWGND
jgi:hypothetical protein